MESVADAPRLTTNELKTAQNLWQRYQKSHDVSSLKGQSAGVDPRTGKILIGESGVEIAQQMKGAGVVGPLYIVRIGFDYYLRKGGRR